MSRIDWLIGTLDPAVTAAGSTAEATLYAKVLASELKAATEGCLDEETGPLLRLLSFFSPAERDTLAGLRYPKRRREWLLGRWTAKHLLRRACPEYAGWPLNRITVSNDPDGAPYLSVDGAGRLACSLSISHRNDRAFCALLALTGQGADRPIAVGADIEQVYPRDPAFVRDFFTAGEAERVWRCPEEQRDTLVTVIWSAKEAVLKVLRLGLTVDTRRVEIRHVAGIESPSPGAWAWIQVECSLPDMPRISAWWRPHTDSVLSLAAFARPDDPPFPRQ